MTSADYALHAIKGIKKSFDNAIKAKIEQYKDNRIFDFYTTPETFEIFTSTEGLNGSKKLGELETPPTLKLEEGYSVTLVEERFGGGIIIPETVYRRDANDTTLKVDTFLKRQRNQLLLDNINLLLVNAFKMLNEGFDSASQYLAPDGDPIFSDSHQWASGGSFDNKGTAVFSEDAVDEAMEAAGSFTDPAGKPMPINFDTIIVKKGSAAAREAKRLFAYQISPTKVADINIYEGEMTVIETPYIVNGLNWFLRDSSLSNSLVVGIGEYPTMREPIKESNEAIRSNVTGFWKQGAVNMPYDWRGYTGAG